MLGAGLQFNRSRNGEDRFYSAAKARRSQSQSQSQSQTLLGQGQDPLLRGEADASVSRYVKEVRGESRRKIGGDQCSNGVAKTGLLESPLCNLERFLRSISPSVPAQHFSEVWGF